MGTEFLFGMIKNFWTEIVVIVTQHVNILDDTELYT